MMSTYASTTGGYNFHRAGCGTDGEACPTAEHGESRNLIDHDHALALKEHRLRGFETPAQTVVRIEAMRLARLDGIADMAFTMATYRRKTLPGGDYLMRLLVRVDHGAALRMNEAPDDTSKRRRLTPPQERALEYLACLHNGDYAVQWGERPKTGTLVALITRGLITAARSGELADHKLTEAGWAHLAW
jgi:hypothetical protein